MMRNAEMEDGDRRDGVAGPRIKTDVRSWRGVW